MYVTANGNVLPCCIAPFTDAAYESIVLGNIFQQTAEEIWNGPQYRAWRRGMLQGCPPDACANCGAGWSL
jgi:radical SAM protein with 4Fe4S-binding SPASM domain